MSLWKDALIFIHAFIPLPLLLLKVQELIVSIILNDLATRIVIRDTLEVPHEPLLLIHLVLGLELELGGLVLGAIRTPYVVVPLLFPYLFQSIQIVYLLLQLVSPHFFDLLLGMVLRNHAAVRHHRRGLSVVAIASIAENIL